MNSSDQQQDRVTHYARVLINRLKRQERREEVRRTPINSAKVEVVEKVDKSPGWLHIVALPHWLITILAVLAFVFWGPSSMPAWYEEAFKITLYAWFVSIPLILALPKPKYESRTEWRQDTYPVSEYGI